MGGGSNVEGYNDVWSYGVHIVPDTLPAADWAKNYSATIVAREGDGPYVWSLVGGNLPPGLALGTSTSDTIAVSGTPTEVGTFTFTIRVEDQGTGDWAEQQITLKIKPPPSPEDRGADDGGGFGSCSLAVGGTGNPAGRIPSRAAGLLALFGIIAATAAAFRWRSGVVRR
jgi:hypothetical protein